MYDGSIFSVSEEDARRVTFKEENHKFREAFERDRDRILYSKEFRRLSGKTQIFVAGFDDNMRTRLTHTLEVAQIAKTMAKALHLNQNLAEAIALGHDVGHTPFGHVGERTLNFIMNGCELIRDFNSKLEDVDKGFKHNWQSVRVLTELEKISENYSGLNLTSYTLWGVLNHSGLRMKSCKKLHEEHQYCNLKHGTIKCSRDGALSNEFYNFGFLDDQLDWTIEAIIVAYADEVAQRHHDIEDGIYAGLINITDLVKEIETRFDKKISIKESDQLDEIKSIQDKQIQVAMISRLIVNFYTMIYLESIIEFIKEIKTDFKIETHIEFMKNKPVIYQKYSNMENENFIKDIIHDKLFVEMDKKFQGYLSSIILNSHLAQSMDGKSDFIIRKLFKAYLTNPQQLPDSTIVTFIRRYDPDFEKKYTNENKATIVGKLRNKLNDHHFISNDYKYRRVLLRVLCDYIAGMTDKFAIDQYELLYGTSLPRKF